MSAKRKIPYGVINWAELVRDCFFVDNTAHIRALETCKTPVFLRPKRFGKSIICSMLEHYYDLLLKDRFGLDPKLKPTVLADLKNFCDGYRFRPMRSPCTIRRSAIGIYAVSSASARYRARSSIRTSARTSAGSAGWRGRTRGRSRWRPDWSAPVETTVVEVCGNQGYNWFDL